MRLVLLRYDSYAPYSPILAGYDCPACEMDIVMRDGSVKRFQYFGYLTTQQCRVIGLRYVKVVAVGICDDRELNGLEKLSEGEYLLGRLIDNHYVSLVTEDNVNPVKFFAPVMPAR